MRRTLAIGGLGFIGINLSRRLVDLGADLLIITPARERHEDEAAALEARGVRVLEGDLRDPTVMHEAVRDRDVIFNLSGRSGAVRSMEDPWTDLDVNCRGSLVLLEAIRLQNPSAKLVFPGSRLQYGKPAGLPVGEDQTMDPLCIHAVHKIAVEKYLRVYERLYGLRFTVLRMTNPYGPGQPGGRTAYGVVNHLIHLALADKSLPVYGDGSQVRDYIYIDDVVTALLEAGARPATDGQVYNLGSGVGTRLVDMARCITEVAGSGRLEFVPWPPLAEQIETGDFVADTSCVSRDLEWQPRVALHDGLRRTIAYYRHQEQ